MKVVSFFAGCGGLDLGFEQAGFNVVWANELDPAVQSTYIKNHPNTKLVIGDICDIKTVDIPECDGFIGGPPCQAWSVAGRQGGLNDKRGRLFLNYIRLIEAKRPKFFLIENAKGLLDSKFKDVFTDFISQLSLAGYDVNWKLHDSAAYNIPQNRERVFIIGFRKDLGIKYNFPQPLTTTPITLKSAIGDIMEPPRQFINNKIDTPNPVRHNHDVYIGKFDSYYQSGNRMRGWNKPSFTIHATGKRIPLHPSSPKMEYKGHENWSFQSGRIHEYRRLSVRECARIQTFPDHFIFDHHDILATYKMIGNAVPPRMGRFLAGSIMSCMSNHKEFQPDCTPVGKHPLDAITLVGYYKSDKHLSMIVSNRLYYVRSDERIGSMFKEDCSTIPIYALLHHKDKSHIFELVEEDPILADSSVLNDMGFETHGNKYLCFRLKNKEPGLFSADTCKSVETIYDKNCYKPYFTTLRKILKTNYESGQ